MKVRIVVQSSIDGNNEYIHFSKDLYDNIENFKIEGCYIDVDTIIEMDEIDGFPYGYDFKRAF